MDFFSEVLSFLCKLVLALDWLILLYFLGWIITSEVIFATEGQLNGWMKAHPKLWPGDYERGRELVGRCVRAYLFFVIFHPYAATAERLRKLGELGKSEEEVPAAVRKARINEGPALL